MFLWSSTFLCNPTVIRSELQQLQTRSCISKTLVKPNKEPDQRYVLERLSGALFSVCETFHYKQCWNIQVCFHPYLNNGTFFCFCFFFLAPNALPARSLWPHSPETSAFLQLLPSDALSQLSKSNEHNIDTSFTLEKEKKGKTDIRNNPINNNCLLHVVTGTANWARRSYFLNFN